MAVVGDAEALERFSAEPTLPRRKHWIRWWIRRPKLTVFTLIIALIGVLAIAAPVLTPYHPTHTEPANALQAPTLSHPMGTDNLGRDVFTRVLYGARISFRVALIAVGIALTFGVTTGLAAGYLGGFVDQVLSRSIDALLAFPGILLAIAITNALGPSLNNAMMAVGILGVPTYFRLTRGQVIQAREFEYVTAATVLGATRMRIVIRHILPNVINPLIIGASIASSGAILSLAALSFLGIGSQPPTPDWGSMIFTGAGYLRKWPWMTLAPGLAIFITVFSFYTLGDALRDALDPHLRNR